MISLYEFGAPSTKSPIQQDVDPNKS
ncbi:hypothetical protein EYZ11_004458 [Aspergillus tanneri]|uniref:Uncharacterized protein n=1 Tax=Aspergillus tanneri TaxID=1220188 RepID=A0A4S3JL11_9EURO|nr:hypothetical protein EYZ11_004458 [Aspergillus tanneri]